MGEALVSCPWGQSSLEVRKTLGREDCLHHEGTAPEQAGLGPSLGRRRPGAPTWRDVGCAGVHTPRDSTAAVKPVGPETTTPEQGPSVPPKSAAHSPGSFGRASPCAQTLGTITSHAPRPARHVMCTFPQTVYHFKYPHVRRPLSVGKYEHVYPFNLLFHTCSKTCKPV